MRHVILIGLLAACGNDQVADDTAIDAPAAADAPEMVTDITANITADATWSGLIKIHNTIQIAPGVTVTVMPHTRIQLAPVAAVQIGGTLNVGGTKDAPVYIEELMPSQFWDAFTLTTAPAVLNMTYVIQTGGGIDVSAGRFTARDSQFSNVTHDLLIVSGGTIDVQYSWIGVGSGQTDTTHCDMHFQGGTPTITMSHSNVSTSAYGVELLSGLNVDFTYDNWFSNTIDVFRQPPATGDVSHGWFKAGNPAITGVTATNMAGAQVADAGPR